MEVGFRRGCFPSAHQSTPKRVNRNSLRFELRKFFIEEMCFLKLELELLAMQLQNGETPAEFTEDGVLIARGCDWNCEQRQLELQTGSVDV